MFSLTATEFKEYAEGIQALLTSVALLGAALLYWFKRELGHRVHMSADIESFHRVENGYVLEPACVITNKGVLRSYVYRLELSVRYLLATDPLNASDKANGATDFPHVAVKRDLIPPGWEWSYIEAGIAQRYSYITHIPTPPADVVAVFIKTKLYHKKGVKDDFYTAQRIYAVKNGELIQNKTAER